MKQINPNPALRRPMAEAPCTGKSLFIWGAYGWLMICLWRVVQGHALAEAAAWAVALAAGLALAIAMREV